MKVRTARRSSTFSALTTALVASAVTLSMGGCSSCTKKPPPEEEVKKDKGHKKSEVPEEPVPNDIAFEAILRDPEAVAKLAVAGAGFSKEVGPSPYQKLIDTLPDETMKKAARALDPDGAMAVVVTAKVDDLLDDDHWKPETVTVVGAAHLKDGDLANAVLALVAKTQGDMKSHPAKAFEGTIYELEKELAVAINGDIILIGDGAAALENAGRYASYLARKGDKQEHDLFVRIPTTELSQKARAAGSDYWEKHKKEVPPAITVELDRLIPPVLSALGDAGDAIGYFDVRGDDLVMEQKMSAKGSLSKWFGSYPSGDASALLAMPKAESAALYRLPGGLGPLTYSLIDESLKKAPLSPADVTDISKQSRILGDALGHEVVYASNSAGLFSAFGSSGKGDAEYLVRIELSDPTAAKGAIVRFRELAEKYITGPYDPKLTVAPYKKFGAEGESIDISYKSVSYKAATADSTLLWAVRGSYAYVDLCVFCKPKLDDDALDPASKNTVASDPTAKSKVSTFPSSGVTQAAYGDIGAYLRAMMLLIGGAPVKSMPPIWGWATATDSGLDARELIPLMAIGSFARAYFTRRYGSTSYPMPLGTTMPLGTAVPPISP